MPVQSSSLTVGHAQADGRRYVTETHTLTVGASVVIEYLAPDGFIEFDATMLARVAQIDAALADGEAEQALDAAGWRVPDHQTAAQLAARIRERFRRGTREEAARIAYWIIERINAGDFTDTQVRNVFGLTAGEWNTLKTNKLVPYHDAWAALLSAQGE